MIASTFLLMLFFACSANVETDLRAKFSANAYGVSFVYHRFDESKYPSTNISLQDFEAHLKYLKDGNFKVLTATEAIAYLKEDNAERIVVLTVDDAYKSFYTGALPLLKKYDMKATLYVNTESVGNRGYMSSDEIKAAHAAGIEIGNHTHTHRYFMNIAEYEREKAFISELEKSQKILEGITKSQPFTMAYPYGEFDQSMMIAVEKAGFIAAFAQNSGAIGAMSSPYALPRYPMGGNFASPEQFKEKLSMRPLPIKQARSIESTYEQNPPKLSIDTDLPSLHTEQVNVFVEGIRLKQGVHVDNGMITVSPEKPLSQRRSLYTITLQNEGKWYWYSYLWINPKLQ